MYPIQCPGCDKQYPVKETAVGKALRCPPCGTEFLIRRAAGGLEAVPTGGVSAAPPGPEEVTPTEEARPGGGMKFALIGLLVLALAGGGVAAFFVLRGDKASDGPIAEEPIDPNKPPRAPFPPVSKPRTVGQAAGPQVIDALTPSTVLIVVPGSVGSGVLVHRDPDIVLTNQHVIKSARRGRRPLVFFPEGRGDDMKRKLKDYSENAERLAVRAEVLWQESRRDVAVLRLMDAGRVPESALPVALAMDSAGPAADVYGVGQSGAKRDALWQPHSGKSRQVLPTDELGRMLITQTPFNPGDSGGPVVNARCELVALVRAKTRKLLTVTRGVGPEVVGEDAVGYAIDVGELRDILDDVFKREFDGPFTTPADVARPAGVADGEPAGEESERPWTPDELAWYLERGDKGQAKVAVAMLGRLGKPAVGRLTETLKSPEHRDRWPEALTALTRIGRAGSAAAGPAIECLSSGYRPTRVAVAKFLAAVAPAGRPALDELWKMISSEDADERAAAGLAVRAHETFGRADLDDLKRRAELGSIYVKEFVLETLVGMRSVGKRDVSEFMDELGIFGPAERRVKEMAAKLMRATPEKFPTGDHFRVFLPRLSDPVPGAKQAAAAHLGRFVAGLTQTDFTALIELADSPEAAEFVAEVLAKVGDRVQIDFARLKPILAERGAAYTNAKARVLLAAVKQKRPLTALADEIVALTRHENLRLRKAAVLCLAGIAPGIHDTRVLAALIGSMNGGNADVRAAALAALKMCRDGQAGRFTGPAQVSLLAQALRSPQVETRRAAARLLADSPASAVLRAVDELGRALGDESAAVRLLALAALAKAGTAPERAVARIAAMVSDGLDLDAARSIPEQEWGTLRGALGKPDPRSLLGRSTHLADRLKLREGDSLGDVLLRLLTRHEALVTLAALGPKAAPAAKDLKALLSRTPDAKLLVRALTAVRESAGGEGAAARARLLIPVCLKLFRREMAVQRVGDNVQRSYTAMAKLVKAGQQSPDPVSRAAFGAIGAFGSDALPVLQEHLTGVLKRKAWLLEAPSVIGAVLCVGDALSAGGKPDAITRERLLGAVETLQQQFSRIYKTYRAESVSRRRTPADRAEARRRYLIADEAYKVIRGVGERLEAAGTLSGR